MPDQIRIYPECHADTALITFLFSNEQVIEHSAGINEVSKALETVSADAKVLLGVVDNDKHKPRYLRQFNTIREVNKVCFCLRPQTNQYLIIIDRAIETFLLWNASAVGIRVTDYGFPVDAKSFGKLLKRGSIETNPDYLRLLADLHARQAPGLMTLQQLLHDLTATP